MPPPRGALFEKTAPPPWTPRKSFYLHGKAIVLRSQYRAQLGLPYFFSGCLPTANRQLASCYIESIFRCSITPNLIAGILFDFFS